MKKDCSNQGPRNYVMETLVYSSSSEWQPSLSTDHLDLLSVERWLESLSPWYQEFSLSLSLSCFSLSSLHSLMLHGLGKMISCRKVLISYCCTGLTEKSVALLNELRPGVVWDNAGVEECSRQWQHSHTRHQSSSSTPITTTTVARTSSRTCWRWSTCRSLCPELQPCPQILISLSNCFTLLLPCLASLG